MVTPTKSGDILHERYTRMMRLLETGVRHGKGSDLLGKVLLLACAGAMVFIGGCGSDAPSPARDDSATGLRIAGVSSLLTQAQARFVAADGQRHEDAHFGTQTAEARIAYGPPGDFHAEATARAEYGTLRGTAVASGREILHPFQGSHAEAAFSDTLMLTGGAGTDTVVYTYTLTGAASGPGHGAHLFIHHGTDPDEELVEDITVAGEFKSLPHRVTFGLQFEIRAVLVCQGRLELGQKGESACRFTAILAAIEVFDESGRPVSGVTARSASGTVYPVVDVAKKTR